MISSTLRFQGDIVVMGKNVLKDSMYEGNRFTPKATDLVLIFSMTGRIFELSRNLLSSLQVANPEIWLCGQRYLLEDDEFVLMIPNAIGEVVENLIINYYFTCITYRYAQRYVHDY